jgi:hypothetical protein
MRNPHQLSLLVACLLFTSVATSAQDEARAIWQVTNFDISVLKLDDERALNARTIVTLRNVGRGSGSTLSLRLNPKIEIKGVTIDGASAAYRSALENRGSNQRITITLPNPVSANGNVAATVDYRFPVEENSGLAAISPVGSQFLPLSLWYPSPSTPFGAGGADFAPFRLTFSASDFVSSGVERAVGGQTVFDQRLNGLPFLITGAWDRLDGSGDGRGISVFLPKGAGADERRQAEAVMGLVTSERSFFASLLGPLPDTQIRLVSVTRGAGFNDAGTILLDEAVFRRPKIDSVTVMTTGESIARLWIGGDTPVRGEGYGVLREGLARFLATLFIEKQFGPDAAEAERARERLAYISVAKRDAPLSRSTFIDETYVNSVSNKGAMVWRLVDHLLGRNAFVGALRVLLQNGKTGTDGLTLGRLRAAVAERGGSAMKALLDQELDQPTDMDLMVGLPRQEGSQWTAALRNLGSIDATVNVVATTDRGERLTVETTIPAHDFGQAVFKGGSRVVRVEVDPEKFYPQVDYSNDLAPRTVSSGNPLGEAMQLFNAQQYAKVEAIARELLSTSPGLQEARILLARSMLGENRTDEAEKEFRVLLEERLPSPSGLAWANVGLGEISLRRGQPSEAARRFNEAVRVDAEYGSTVAARAGRLRAEAAANVAPAVDESARSFINQLDQAIRSGKRMEIDPVIVSGELVKFIRGIVGTQPEVWQTHVLRTELLDANRLAADVTLNTKQLGAEHSGSAVLVLERVGGGWKLGAIEFFEVR